jgi:hypothetical protein
MEVIEENRQKEISKNETTCETLRKASKIVAFVQWELEGRRPFRAGA